MALGSSATVYDLTGLVKVHRGLIGRREYKSLGRLVKIVLAELPKGVTLGISDVERLQEGRTLDWFDKGPLLGLGAGEIDLLVTSPVPALPKKPQPGYKVAELTQPQIEEQLRTTGKYTPPTAPLVEQRPEDRGCTRVKGTNFLCFEPVHELLFHPIGVQRWGRVSFMTDNTTASGSHTAFVWDFQSNEGFFYGGRFLIEL